MTRQQGQKNLSSRTFTLIEVLAALILIIAVLTISTAIVVTALKSISNANNHMTQARTLDAAIAQLRQDVWASSKIAQPDPQSILLSNAKGYIALWEVTPTHQLKRAVPPIPMLPRIRTFDSAPSDLTITVKGPLVIVQSKDASGRDALVTLPSELLIAGGKP